MHREMEERLKNLAIHLTWIDARNIRKHGTAFFVTSDGLALTAFHNIDDTLGANPSAQIEGCWQGEHLRLRWMLPEEQHRRWQQENDIAVLQAEDRPEGIAVLGAGYLDPSLSDSQRGEHWRGSGVLVAGFPKGNEYHLDSGHGFVDHASPIETIQVKESRREGVLSFTSSIVADGSAQGPGLSGSPVYSTADGSIVGIIIAARTKLYATELWPIQKHWDQSGSFLKRIRRRTGSLALARTRLLWVAVASSLAALVLSGLLWRQTRHAIPQQLSAQVSRIDAATGEATTEHPVQDGDVFKAGERVRFHFTSPKDGHLYVVDQEIVNGHPGEPLIIFPTLRTGATRNLVKAGDEVDFPSKEDAPPYVEASPPDVSGYEGEQLTMLIFPQPLPIELKETPVPLEPALFSLDGMRPRAILHPLAASADALAMRRIRLNVTR